MAFYNMDEAESSLETSESGDRILTESTQRFRSPFLAEFQHSRKQSTARKKRASFQARISVAMEVPASNVDTATGDSDNDEHMMMDPCVLKTGALLKTTIRSGKKDSKSWHTRQRYFRLTEEALEYFHQFTHMKVKRSFPLISIEKVEYSKTHDPTIFRLIFSNFIEILQAETAEEASDWVEKISEACAQWYPDESFDELSPIPEGNSMDEGIAKYNTMLPLKQPKDEQHSESSVNSKYEDLLVKHKFTASKTICRRFSSPEMLGLGRLPFEDKSKEELGLDKNFLIIKYPRHMFGVPTTRVFKMDTTNMQIMWKRNHHSRFQSSRSLSLRKVMEVREGQKTERFDKFPRKQVENRSFSLVYPHEDKHYAYLKSLDLISDHQKNYNLWINEIKSKVKGEQPIGTHPNLSSRDNDTTDTTLLWLKQLWSCKSENDELAESAAVKVARKLNPFISKEVAKSTIEFAHLHQVESSHGLSLDFSGFVLLFSLLHETRENTLYSIFKKYAKAHPQLGITLQEFREFLVNECCWQRETCTNAELHKLMKVHDSYHQAYKKYSAMNKSSEFVAGYKLLSFAGFLSFLCSTDNPAIDPEHKTVYQDMTQPLSHYFINSSHNTYLEGDQLRGKSSTDAYVRAFFQGCRCVEIDCWDGSFKHEEREPIIYHGHTLTTKLPFRDVINTIKDYSFSHSNYPLIVSIENHCSKDNQTRMATIFRTVFDDMLPKEDLVRLEERTRLPSPQELQGKIILKGKFNKPEVTKKPTVLHQMLIKLKSSSTLSTCPTDSTPMTLCPVQPLSLQQNSVNIGEVDTENELNSVVDSDAAILVSPLQTGDSASEALHSDDEDKHHSKTHFRERTRSMKEIRHKVAETEQGQDDQELEFKDIIEDLRSLIIYAKAISIKPWSWEKQKATSITQMFSFGEPKAVELCTKSAREMLACTERQLVRTYPKGTRFDSSNYDPMQLWICGVQMVSLNFQYPDVWMHLNQGLFRLNGGCGYVLKPDVMRRKNPGGGSNPFDPEMQEPHPDVPAIDFQIELISGQRLCLWKKKHSSVTVNIHTYGIIHDCARMREASHNNVLWPHWKKGRHHLTKTIYMPELCLVYFRVEADRKLFGQNCIPVISLQPGIKFIPLRTPGGELIPGSGLFVKIRKAAAAVAETTAENTSCDALKVPHPPRARSKISKQKKQVSFNLDNVVFDDEITIEEGLSVCSDIDEMDMFGDSDEDVEVADCTVNVPEKPILPRRFSSPAFFESSSLREQTEYWPLYYEHGDQSRSTTIAEVYEDETHTGYLRQANS